MCLDVVNDIIRNKILDTLSTVHTSPIIHTYSTDMDPVSDVLDVTVIPDFSGADVIPNPFCAEVDVTLYVMCMMCSEQ